MGSQASCAVGVASRVSCKKTFGEDRTNESSAQETEVNFMCGIVGYVGDEEAVPILIGGLAKLEYRGYDSAGIAVMQGERIEVRRSVGKLANLQKSLAE